MGASASVKKRSVPAGASRPRTTTRGDGVPRARLARRRRSRGSVRAPAPGVVPTGRVNPRGAAQRPAGPSPPRGRTAWARRWGVPSPGCTGPAPGPRAAGPPRAGGGTGPEGCCATTADRDEGEDRLGRPTGEDAGHAGRGHDRGEGDRDPHHGVGEAGPVVLEPDLDARDQRPPRRSGRTWPARTARAGRCAPDGRCREPSA